MALQFAVLGSGSRGNSTLIGQEGGPGLLIDIGLGPRALGQRLESVGSDWSRITAVFLTHTHGDHLDSATLVELGRRKVLLYCHDAHREMLEEDQGFVELDRMGLVRQYDGQPLLAPCGFRIEPFPLWHDGPTFGFRIESVARRRPRAIAFGYLADTGSWSESMAECLTDVDVLGIEFNHDVAMQKASGRSPALIARNLGDRGHLSNRQAAELVRSILRRSSRERVGHLVLLHLSEQCNRPELAIHEAREAVQETGRRVLIHAARQSPAHPNLQIDGRRPSTSAGWAGTKQAGSPVRVRGTRASTAGFLPGLNLELDLVEPA
ncbi:MAG: MBL fold metallo-hydrolase [Planctomycetaceae bacterium]|nr:MBL fold metallo-hydrolase [Planctomycetaceae bacterium]